MDDRHSSSLEALVDRYPGWDIRPQGALLVATRRRAVEVWFSRLRLTIITDTTAGLARELDLEREHERQHGEGGS